MTANEAVFRRGIESRREELEALKAQLLDRQKAVSLLEEKHNGIVGEIERLRQPPPDYKAEIDRLQSRLDSLRRDVETKRSGVESQIRAYEQQEETRGHATYAPALADALSRVSRCIQSYMWLCAVRAEIEACAGDSRRVMKRLGKVDLNHAGIPEKVDREFDVFEDARKT